MSVKQILRHFVSQLTILPVIKAAMCQKISEPVSHLARHAASHVPMCQKTTEPVSHLATHSASHVPEKQRASYLAYQALR
jgi:hypothetical protein